MHQAYLEEFEKRLKEQGKKNATIQSYRSDLKDFLLYAEEMKCPLDKMDTDLVYHYFERLQGAKGPAPKQNSIRRKSIAIKQFFRCVKNDDESEILQANSSMERLAIPARIEKKGALLSDTSIQKLFDACDHTWDLKKTRDTAIVALLCYEGLKISELCQLTWKEYFPDTKSTALVIPGERQRAISLSPETTEIMASYKRSFEDHLEGPSQDDRIFVAFQGSHSRTTLSKISRHGLKFLLYQLAEGAGLGELNSEMLRQYAVRHLSRQGMNAEGIMKHFGLKRLGKIAYFFQA